MIFLYDAAFVFLIYAQTRNCCMYGPESAQVVPEELA